MQEISTVGKKFGRLTVIQENTGYNADNRVLRKCICECGNIVFKTLKQLKKSFPYCGSNCLYKICPGCKKDKSISEYSKCQSNKNGLQPKCKECQSKIYLDKKHLLKSQYLERRKNPENIIKDRLKNRKSRSKRVDKEKIYKKSYIKLDHVKNRRKCNHKYRKENDPIYNIKRRLRGRVRDILKSIGEKTFKYKSSLVLLGCDMDFFKSYLENKFTFGMCWGNISEWHIDHIKPCCKFDLTILEEQQICFHYKNLQPLWGIENLVKSDKYIDLPEVTTDV